MCLICVEFQKQKMTIFEARSAYREMVVAMTPDHAREVRDMLNEAEVQEKSAASTPPDDDDASP